MLHSLFDGIIPATILSNGHRLLVTVGSDVETTGVVWVIEFELPISLNSYQHLWAFAYFVGYAEGHEFILCVEVDNKVSFFPDLFDLVNCHLLQWKARDKDSWSDGSITVNASQCLSLSHRLNEAQLIHKLEAVDVGALGTEFNAIDVVVLLAAEAHLTLMICDAGREVAQHTATVVEVLDEVHRESRLSSG